MLSKRSAITCTALLAAMVLLQGCGGAQSRFATHMKRGQAYFSQGDFTKASIEFRNAMQIEPKDATARVMAGRANERLGHVREAAALYQAVVDTAPDNVEARASLARLMVLAGAPEQAKKVLEPALAKHPDDPSLLAYRAAARMQLKDRDGAIADVDRALQLAPATVDAITLRADLYRQDGDVARATALVSDAVGKMPDSIDLRTVLTDLYVNAGDSGKAEEQLRALIRLRPQETRFRNQLALFYARSHKLDDAQRVLEDAVKALPNSDEAKLTLVDFVSTQRTRAEGEKTLKDFIARKPDDYDLRLGLGALLQRAGSTQDAIAAYQEIIQRDGTGPKGLIARTRIAAIDVSGRRYDDARKLIGEVLEKNPHDNDALFLRGEIALAQTDPTSAIGDLRAVLRDQPQSVSVRRLLAQAYMANHEPGLAEESLRAAVEAAPTDTSLRIELANVLVQSQRAEQGVALLEEAVRHAPMDAPVREALTRAYLEERNFPAARSAADDLKTLLPTSPIGFYLAGLSAQGQNQLAEAQKQFEQGLNIQPEALDILSSLARVELAQGHGEQAIALVKKAVDQYPPNAYRLNLLGELYVAQKNLPLANDALTRATTLAPKWWMPYRNLALAKLAANDVAGAIAAYQAGIKAAPAEPVLVTEFALLYEKQRRVDEAIALYEDWNQHNPGVQIVANNLAMLLATYKQDRKSLDLARDLSAPFASSNDSSLLDTNGWVHFKRAEYADAVPVLERAVERAPNSKEIHYHLGMAELHAGKADLARNELKTAVSGSATFRGSDEARTVLASLN